MTDDLEALKVLVDGALDVVLRTQALVSELLDRITVAERRINKLEEELEPQLIELTKLLKEVVGKERLN